MNCNEACDLAAIDWPSWLTAVGTISLAILAVFQDKIRAFLLKPKLTVSISTNSPDSVKTPMQAGQVVGDAYWFRLRIGNEGNTSANNIEVLAQRLFRRNADNTFTEDVNFQPMNLLWAHFKTPFLEAISPSTFKFCDVGFIPDPARFAAMYPTSNPAISVVKTALFLETVVKPFNSSNVLPPGFYRLSVVVAANNAKPITATIEINHTGDWHADTARMSKEGIGLTVSIGSK
ncbi:MAG TPA: hypothetical protein VKC51_01120 [Lacunisphaera sp.]|nr:hypothetical protein [Lacunisphaera sp.]